MFIVTEYAALSLLIDFLIQESFITGFPIFN